MAKITSKASLNIGTELTVDTGTRIITLNIAGNLVAKDGVTWQALYSKLIQLWESATYNAFPFPFYTIDALSGQFNIGFDGTRYNTWTFAGTPTSGTRLYLRDGGWNEYTATTPGADGTAAAGTVNSIYSGVVSLGAVSASAQLYYQKVSAGAAIDFTYTDAANLGVQVYGDASHGSLANADYLKGFCRVYGKKYTESVLADTGKSATGAYLINLLLSNSDDLDATGVYADIITSPVAPYDKMKINYFTGAFSRDVDTVASPRDFGIVVDVSTHSGIDGVSNGTTTFTTAAAGIVGADFVGGTLVVHEGAGKGTYNISGTPAAGSITTTAAVTGSASNLSFTLKPAVASTATLRQIYSFVQAKLIQAASINSQGTSVVGKTASLLMNWTAKLVCGGGSTGTPINPAGGGTGVCVEGVSDADINTIQFYDNTTTLREYPYASAGSLEFSANLVGGWYVLYYSDLTSTNDWGTAAAVVVRDKNNVAISGAIGSQSVSFSYDYTNQTEAGKRTGGTDTAVTLVAGKSGSAKPVVVATNAAGGLTASKSIKITATAETDRAYQ